jgi:hypothetical protein
LFAQYGAPLVLKRDNGSNLNGAAVDAVLARHCLIPLNSPPRYPPYSGGIERAQCDLKAALRAHGPATALAVHDLNHRPRRVLGGLTACQPFAGAKLSLCSRGVQGVNALQFTINGACGRPLAWLDRFVWSFRVPCIM